MLKFKFNHSRSVSTTRVYECHITVDGSVSPRPATSGLLECSTKEIICDVSPDKFTSDESGLASSASGSPELDVFHIHGKLWISPKRLTANILLICKVYHTPDKKF